MAHEDLRGGPGGERFPDVPEVEARQMEVVELVRGAEQLLKAFHIKVPPRAELRERLRIFPVETQDNRTRGLLTQHHAEQQMPHVVLFMDQAPGTEDDVRGVDIDLTRQPRVMRISETYSLYMTLHVGDWGTRIVRMPDIVDGRSGALMDMYKASSVSQDAMPGEHGVAWGQRGDTESVLFVALHEDGQGGLSPDVGFIKMRPGFEQRIVRDGRLIAGAEGREGTGGQGGLGRSGGGAMGEPNQAFLAEKERVRKEIAEKGIKLEDLERYRLRGFVEPDQYRALRRQGVQQAFAGGWIIGAEEAQAHFDRGDITQAQLDSVIVKEAADREAVLQRAAEIRAQREAEPPREMTLVDRLPIQEEALKQAIRRGDIVAQQREESLLRGLKRQLGEQGLLGEEIEQSVSSYEAIIAHTDRSEAAQRQGLSEMDQAILRIEQSGQGVVFEEAKPAGKMSQAERLALVAKAKERKKKGKIDKKAEGSRDPNEKNKFKGI